MDQFRSWFVLFGFLLIGCSEELGPTKLETTRVEGSISVGGQPVTAGWVEFSPVDGTVGRLRSAPISPQGKYRADGVPVGRVSVGLANAPHPAPKGADPALMAMFQPFRTPIRKQIAAGSETRLDLDLAAEKMAYQTLMETMRRAMTELSK